MGKNPGYRIRIQWLGFNDSEKIFRWNHLEKITWFYFIKFKIVWRFWSTPITWYTFSCKFDNFTYHLLNHLFLWLLRPHIHRKLCMIRCVCFLDLYCLCLLQICSENRNIFYLILIAIAQWARTVKNLTERLLKLCHFICPPCPPANDIPALSTEYLQLKLHLLQFRNGTISISKGGKLLVIVIYT